MQASPAVATVGRPRAVLSGRFTRKSGSAPGQKGEVRRLIVGEDGSELIAVRATLVMHFSTMVSRFTIAVRGLIAAAFQMPSPTSVRPITPLGTSRR